MDWPYHVYKGTGLTMCIMWLALPCP